MGTLVSLIVKVTFPFAPALVMLMITCLRILLLLLVKILIGLMVLHDLELWLLMSHVLIVVTSVEVLWAHLLIGVCLLLLARIKSGISPIRAIWVMIILMK